MEQAWLETPWVLLLAPSGPLEGSSQGIPPGDPPQPQGVAWGTSWGVPWGDPLGESPGGPPGEPSGGPLELRIRPMGFPAMPVPTLILKVNSDNQDD